MIKALCASLLLSASASVGSFSLPEEYTPAVSDVDLSVVVDDVTLQRIYYNETAYFEFHDSGDYDTGFCVGPDNFFYYTFYDESPVSTVGFEYSSYEWSVFNDWNSIYFNISSGSLDIEEGFFQPGVCFSIWVESPLNGRFTYYEFIWSSNSYYWNGFVFYDMSGSISLDQPVDEFVSFGVEIGDKLHFDPLPAVYYDFLAQQGESQTHPLLPRTQPKLPPDAVTNKDFNLWNTVRDFYVRFLFGGTDSQGTVYNKASFGSVPTSSFNVDVGDNSVSMGDWLSSTLTIITFALFVLVIVLVVRWIAVCIGNAVMGVSGR